jgi:hypothetical protein
LCEQVVPLLKVLWPLIGRRLLLLLLQVQCVLCKRLDVHTSLLLPCHVTAP